MISELHSNLANELLCTGGKVLEVNRKSPLSPAIIMWRLLIGSQTPEDDAECETFMTAIDTWLETGVVGDGLLIIAPFLKHLIPGITGYTAKMELLKVSIEIAQVLTKFHTNIIKCTLCYKQITKKCFINNDDLYRNGTTDSGSWKVRVLKHSSILTFWKRRKADRGFSVCLL